MVTWPSQSLRTTDPDRHPGYRVAVAGTSRRAERLPRPRRRRADRGRRGPLPDAPPARRRRAVPGVVPRPRGGRATPVNTIAVLSRADEIGVGRVDALLSARRIATRYRADDTLRGLCQTVVAVAGLLAQTGTHPAPGRVHRARGARRAAPATSWTCCCCPRTGSPIATRQAGDRSRCARAARPLRAVRAAAVDVAAPPGLPTPAALADRAGRPQRAGRAAEVLATQFTERRDVLKARSALLALERVLTGDPQPAAAPLAAEVERILAARTSSPSCGCCPTCAGGGHAAPRAGGRGRAAAGRAGRRSGPAARYGRRYGTA